jgi:type IV secretory pathway TraG/TraD family ATPase VirD4
MALRVSRYMGEQEKEVASESISFGAHQMRDGVNLSHQIQTKPVVSASQVMLLQNLEAYLRFPGSFPIAKITFSYLKCAIHNVVFIAKPPKPKSRDSEEKVTEGIVSAGAQIISLNFKENKKEEENQEDATEQENSEEKRLSSNEYVCDQTHNLENTASEDKEVELFL